MTDPLGETAMNTERLKKLKRLQDVYAAHFGLSVWITDKDGCTRNDPSELNGFNLSIELGEVTELIRGINKPVLYEIEGGINLVAARIRSECSYASYIFVGGFRTDSVWNLENEHETMAVGMSSMKVFNQEQVEELVNKVEEFVSFVQMVIDQGNEEDKHAKRLHLINLLTLMDVKEPNWMDSVLEVFMRVTDLEHVGIALKEKDEQFTITVAKDSKGESPLQGIHFYTGQGFLGQVALTKQMGYWENPVWDPRVAFFHSLGISPKMMICYPVKYKDHLYGLLFGIHTSSSELSEQVADLGALIAHQLAASYERIEAEQLEIYKNMGVLSLQEMIPGLLHVKDVQVYCQMVIDSLQWTMQSPLTVLIVKGVNGLRMEAGPLSEQYGHAYEQILLERYFSQGATEVLTYRKPAQREWNGMQWIEVPLYYNQILIGVCTTAVKDKVVHKDLFPFLNMMTQLLIVKLNTQQYQERILSSDGTVDSDQPDLEYIGLCTPRESEVFKLVLDGCSNQEIATSLCISTHTVKNHITKIYDKLGVSDRTGAFAKMYHNKVSAAAATR
jgi:DNA-binding CsgD family transcriptional regulator